MNGSEGIHAEIKKYRERIDSDKATAAMHRTSLVTYREKLDRHRLEIETLNRTNVLFQKVAADTQESVQVHIDGLTSSAQAAVFDDPYEFTAKFIAKRGKTECVFSFIRNQVEFPALGAVGGGPVDIASLSLRLAIWGIKKNRPVMWLDEPCKFVSKDRLSYVVDMLNTLTSKLGIQMIMISHIKEFKDAADNVIVIKKGKPYVEQGD